jgi:hypothetical protein
LNLATPEAETSHHNGACDRVTTIVDLTVQSANDRQDDERAISKKYVSSGKTQLGEEDHDLPRFVAQPAAADQWRISYDCHGVLA